MKGVFLVTGTAGTGKSTILKHMTSQGFDTLGLDEEPGLVTWMHKKTRKPAARNSELTEEFLSEHDWGCNMALLQKLISQKNRPLIICGSCDGIEKIMLLCEKTVILVCEPKVFLPRLIERTDNGYGKTDAARKEILGYYQGYRDNVVARGGVVVNAAMVIDHVVNQVKQSFDLI